MELDFLNKLIGVADGFKKKFSTPASNGIGLTRE
jgi:hypothetical protein